MTEIVESLARTVLPLARHVAGGLLGSGSAVVVSMLENLFGVGVDKLSSAIQEDPFAKDKLREFEIKHKEFLLNHSLQAYETQVSDTKNARDMQRDPNNKHDWVLHALACLFTLGFFAYIAVVHFSSTDCDKEIRQDLFGCELLILSFYFGSAYKRH